MSQFIAQIEVKTDRAPAPIGHYSQGLLTLLPNGTNTLAISGQLGVDLETGALLKSVEEETEAALNYVGAILEAAGMKKENVTRVRVYLYEINENDVVDGICTRFFGKHKPARELVEVSWLSKAANVEIAVDAVSYTDPNAVPADTETPDLFEGVDTPAQPEVQPPDSDINSEVDGAYSSMLEGGHLITDQQVEVELGGHATDQSPEPAIKEDPADYVGSTRHGGM